MTIPLRRLGATLILCAVALPASAQTAGQAPPQTDISGANGDLSQKLQNSSGVIHPQEQVDPKIQKAPPATGTMPVIPPPGTPGGRTDIVPK